MNRTNLERLADFFHGNHISAALLSNPWTLTWLTGYAPPIQTGPNPFEGAPALAWWQGGELNLITSDGEAGALRAASGLEVHEYAGYTIDEPLTVVERQSDVLRKVLGSWDGRGATVAVEMRFLPAALLQTVQEALPGAGLRPVDGQLEPLRAVKTPEEIVKLRAALALCDLSQTTAQALIRPGISEVTLWGEMKGRLEAQAGQRLPVLADLVGGVRTGDMGGLPGPYRLQEGDAVIADIVPRLDGYWGDICGTHFVGEPPAEMVRIRNIVLETLRRGIDAVRPGLLARDLDAMLRESIRSAGYEPHPHHSGHGLGVSYHEEPRLVPYNDTALAPGMVIAIEPGIYLPGSGGVRLENVVLVTGDGCELLTHHLD